MARAVVVNAAQLASYSQSKQALLDSGMSLLLSYQSPELGRLLTNCSLLLIKDYVTKIVVRNVICYITRFR